MTWRNHPLARGQDYQRAIAGEKALRERGFKQHEIDATIRLALDLPPGSVEDAMQRFDALWKQQGKSPEQIANVLQYHEQVASTGVDPYAVAERSADDAAKRTAGLRALSADPGSEYWQGRHAEALQREHQDLIQLGLDRAAASESISHSSANGSYPEAAGAAAAPAPAQSGNGGSGPSTSTS